MGDDVITRRGDSLVKTYHGESSSQLTSLGIRHICVTDCRKLRDTSLESPPIAYTTDQIQWTSVQTLSIYYICSDGLVMT